MIKKTLLAGLTAAIVAGAAATAPAMAAESAVGLFIGCYQVGGTMAGAPTVKLNLAFNAPHHTASGQAILSQAVNPPLYVVDNVFGPYMDMTVMGPKTSYRIDLTGTQAVTMPSGGGLGPVLPPNLKMTIVLNDGWQKGTADYKYTTGLDDQWTSVEGAPVEQVSCTTAK